MANPLHATSGPKAVADTPELDELRDGLVFPAYRQFCRDNGLDIQEADEKLHAEAMDLFNQFKPHYTEFRGQVVQFRLGSWGGGFDRTVQPMEEFLSQVVQDQAKLAKLEKWFEIIADTGVISLALVCMVGIDRLTKDALPDWIVAVVFMSVGGLTWRWFFLIRPKKLEEKKQATLKVQLEQLRQKLVAKQLAIQVKRHGLAEAALPKLADALAEHIMSREAEEPEDGEHRRYILADINNLLKMAGPGAELEQHFLGDPNQLRSHLRASMEFPAQMLAMSFPNRLQTWLRAEPMPKHPDRIHWAEEGRYLLDKVSLNPGTSE